MSINRVRAVGVAAMRQTQLQGQHNGSTYSIVRDMITDCLYFSDKAEWRDGTSRESCVKRAWLDAIWQPHRSLVTIPLKSGADGEDSPV